MTRKPLLPMVLAVALLAPPLAAPSAQPVARPSPADAVATGRALAERDCASCHAVGREGESPFEGAPRWRDLPERFNPEDLAESLAEGISVGHEAMPERSYDPDEVRALIAYIKSLEQ